jgi:hypothetical protein
MYRRCRTGRIQNSQKCRQNIKYSTENFQTEILISPWAIQRNPKYWDSPGEFVDIYFSGFNLRADFKDEFIPERWEEDHHSPFTFTVFSAGPRYSSKEF